MVIDDKTVRQAASLVKRVAEKKEADEQTRKAEADRLKRVKGARAALSQRVSKAVSSLQLIGLPLKPNGKFSMEEYSWESVRAIYMSNNGAGGNETLVSFVTHADDEGTRAWLTHDDDEVSEEVALAIIVDHVEKRLDA